MCAAYEGHTLAGVPFTLTALKVPDPYAVKVARTVLGGRKLHGYQWLGYHTKNCEHRQAISLR